MKRILLGAMAQLSALAFTVTEMRQVGSTVKTGRRLRNWWGATHTTSRQPRNPADPIQAARIEAAAVKRARRADNAQHYAMRSDVFNTAHRNCANYLSLTSTR